MKNTEQLEERVLRRGAKTGHKNSLSSTGGHLVEPRRSFRDIRLTEAARCLGQNAKTLNINRFHPTPTLETRGARASKTKVFSVRTPLVSTGMASSYGPTTKKLWTVSRSLSGFGAPNCSPPQFGAGARERGMAAAGVSARETGGSGIRYRDALSPHGIHTGPEKGPVSSSKKKWERPAAFRPSHHTWAGGTSCSSLFLVSSRPGLLFKSFQNPMGKHRPGIRTGNMVGGMATVLEIKGRLFVALQVLQEREDLRDDYRELGKNCHHFLGGAPPGNSFLAPGACTSPMDVKSLYSSKFGVPGPFRLTKGGAWAPRFFASSSSGLRKGPD
ncbi:hypothetical protein GWK47_006212 [Chionoecetes opilio]|uniref:Uncharacterized protein n=1 Tax=Chionoecetes opilio TaxID=41210 RepID=A0A8J4Y640_CHIOP|nr:hypothetical protein GWK47_006212 [Chionoecetes opilio]